MSEAALAIVDEASLSEARERVRALGRALAMPAEASESLVTVASELARNQLVHARGGRFFARAVERAGVPGIEIVAVDEGPGIARPERAFLDACAQRGSLGAGLAGALRLSDELDLDARLGEGTLVAARKFAGRVPYKSEVGVFGRALPGERVSGDGAAFFRHDDELTLAVVDGLGHGEGARAAADAALAVLSDEHAGASLESLLASCDRALGKARGAVMSLARLCRARAEIVSAGVGNVETHVYFGNRQRRFAAVRGRLGALGQAPRRGDPEREHHRSGAVVVMFSDGLTSKTDLSVEPALLGEHPFVIAGHLMAAFARAHDDAIVLVAR